MCVCDSKFSRIREYIYNKGYGHFTLTEFVLFPKTRHEMLSVICYSSGPFCSLYFSLNTSSMIALHLAVLTKIAFGNKRRLRMEELILLAVNGAIWVNTNRSNYPDSPRKARALVNGRERKGLRKKRLTFVFLFSFTPILRKAHERQERRSGQG